MRVRLEWALIMIGLMLLVTSLLALWVSSRSTG